MQTGEKNPISIAMLFYVLTLAGIVASCVGRIEGDVGTSRTTIWVATIVGSVLGTLIGSVGGGFYFRSIMGALVSLFVGGLLGAVGGVLTVIRDVHFLPMMTLAFSGCWLLVVLMLVKARFSTMRVTASNLESNSSTLD